MDLIKLRALSCLRTSCQLSQRPLKPLSQISLQRTSSVASIAPSPSQIPSESSAASLVSTPLSPSIGVVTSIPYLDPLPPRSVFQHLYSLFLTHGVLVLCPFQPSPLSPNGFLSLASAFGRPQSYPFLPGISAQHPQIILVLKQPWETTNFGGIWHSDTTYLARPPKATVLMAEEVPENGGGDTLFANQHLAYDGLSSGLKSVLSGLRGVSTSSKADTSRTREERIKDSTISGQSKPPEVHEAVHPVVRTHDETGRKGLYINIAHTARFEGWTEAESEPLLKYLHREQVKNEYVCRHKWRVGDVAIWDNRCVLHYPVNDYQGRRRSMLRTTLEGGVPV